MFLLSSGVNGSIHGHVDHREGEGTARRGGVSGTAGEQEGQAGLGCNGEGGQRPLPSPRVPMARAGQQGGGSVSQGVRPPPVQTALTVLGTAAWGRMFSKDTEVCLCVSVWVSYLFL